MSDSTLLANKRGAVAPENWIDFVERQVRVTKYGSVQITIHDGRVVQIETSAKIRFAKST